MKRCLLPYFDGKYLDVKRNQIDNALPYITSRIYRQMPLILVDIDEVNKVVDYIHVKVKRDCTPEEVAQLVEQIKRLMRDALDGMPHYERPAEERGRYHVP